MPRLSNLPPNLQDLLNAEDGIVVRLDGLTDYQVVPGEQVILVDAPPSATVNITLPTVSSVSGQAIVVIAMTNDTGTITIKDQGGTLIALADVVLTVAFDYAYIQNVSGIFYRSLGSVAT